MSIFETDSSIARPSDGVVNYRVTEVSADGGATSGQLKFRWQSSATQYWLPKNSYAIIRIQITKDDNEINEATRGITAMPVLPIRPGMCSKKSVPILMVAPMQNALHPGWRRSVHFSKR